MKVLLFRFEWDKINFIECNISKDRFVLWAKEKISLDSSLSKWEKYKKVMDELLLLNTRYSPDLYAYQMPQKYMWKIMDPEGFALSCILNLFSFAHNFRLLELTHPITRWILNIPEKSFKAVFEDTKKILINDYNIWKSDKLLEGLSYLYLIRPE